MGKKKGKQAEPGGNGAPVGRPYFLSLTVENVRCFGAKQTLRLHDGQGRPARWTLILGDNGMGKTTLLRALAVFAHSSLPPALESVKVGEPTSPEWRAFYSRTSDHHQLRRSATVELKVEAEMAFRAGLGEGQQVPAEVARLTIQAGEILISQRTMGDFPFCCGYGASRRLAPASVSRPDVDDPAANLFDDSIPLRNAEEWLLQIHYSSLIPSDVQERQKRRLELVKHLLLHILPEIDDLRISTPSEQQPTPRVEFHTPYGWVHLRALGYGYQTLIAWMVDLASRLVERHPDSPDPLAEPAVVLVDEIDLHLHPQWQRKLIGHLTERFPNAQFVATAHSPLVVQSAGDANVVLLRREGDHVVIDNDVHSVRGWRIDQIYTSELFGLPTSRPPEVEAMLQRRRALLEKADLTEQDRREIAELEEKIGELPAGETAEQIETHRAIRESLEVLKQSLGTKR